MNQIEKIYQDNEYLKEKNKFYYLINNKKLLIVESDGENYLIGREAKNYPIWLWSKEKLTKEKVQEIKQVLIEKYLLEEENTLICKKELYEELKTFFQTFDYFEMGYLECEELKKYKVKEGVFAKANYGDKIPLAKLWQAFYEEAEHQVIELNDSLEEVENWLKEDCFYVWKNRQGKIISMASYNIEKNVAKISHVFTKTEERNKNYCTSLIYSLTKKLLENNLHPVLYTDYHYKASNRSYQKIGYKDKGILIRFKICIPAKEKV